MKNLILRTRALERLYQKAVRLIREDEDRLITMDPVLSLEFDPEKRAKNFISAMSNRTQVFLITYIQEHYGSDSDEFDDFLWLMPALPASIFSLNAALGS